MKVLNPRSALLSDMEMLSLLQEMEADQQSAGTSAGSAAVLHGNNEDAVAAAMAKVPSNLRTVQYEALNTLMQVWRPCAHQRPEHIHAFHTALKKAGFIGGRRGVDLTGSASGSSKTKPRRVSSSRNKRAQPIDDDDDHDDDDDDDDDDGGQPKASTSGSGLLSASEYNPDERGPDEILPDRALTKAERLQLVNHVPRSDVELHTLVEEVSVRFTPSQILELLELVYKHLPLPPMEGEAQEQGEMELDEGGGEGGVADLSGEGAADETAANNGLFMGGAEDEEYVAEDDDDWVNEGRGGGGDDLEGDNANDDDEA